MLHNMRFRDTALIIACMLLIPACSTPKLDEPLTGELTCKYFGQTDQTLAVKTAAGELIRLVDMNFRISPFLPTILSCQQWLDSLSLSQQLSDGWKVLPTLAHEDVDEGRLIDEARSDLYRQCHRSPLCKVRFPYTLGWWRLEEAFHPAPSSAFGANEALCTAPAKKTPVRTRPLKNISIIGKDDLEEVQVWSSPSEALIDRIETLIRKKQKGTLFVSAMTVHSFDITRLIVTLREHPEVDLYLIFDLAANLSSWGIYTWIESASEQLHLVPLAARPDMPTFYHIKGVASPDEDGRFIFTGLNLTGGFDEPLGDIGFEAKSIPVAQAYAKVLSDQLRRVCEEPAYALCTVDAKTAASDPFRYEIVSALATSCKHFFDSGLPRRLEDVKNPYFLTTQEDDVLGILTELIASSKVSATAYTHRIDSWPLILAMKKASEQGKEVHLYAGRRGDHPLWKFQEAEQLLEVLDRHAPLEFHSKFVMIDDALVLWGTGNLTKNGLQNAEELFFLTDHPTLIRSILEYGSLWKKSN